MKYVAVLIALAITGCIDRVPQISESKEGLAESCLNGIVYYRFSSYPNHFHYTVKYNADGSVQKCRAKEE